MPVAALLPRVPVAAGSGLDNVTDYRFPEATRTRRFQDDIPVVRLQSFGPSFIAVWEWNDAREVRFGVLLAATPGEAAAGIGTVSGSLGPLSTVTTASEGAMTPIPRFARTQAPRELVIVDE